MTDFSDLRKRADELVGLVGLNARLDTQELLRDLIARLDDADKKVREHLSIQEERRLGLRP